MSRANDYEFVTQWQVAADVGTVYQILDDVESLPRWWPEVYLEVKILDRGDVRGIGKRVGLWTRGWLPYTLRWEFIVLEKDAPHRLRLEASGDFVGRGEWNLRQVGAIADIRYDWRIRAEKPLLRHLSAIMRPIFAWNHRWAMARGLEGLQRELQRVANERASRHVD